MKARRQRPETRDKTVTNSECKSLQDMRKAHIERVLGMTGGNVDEAAKILRLSVTALRRWMTTMGIHGCR